MNPYLLEVIACPKSKEKLIYQPNNNELIALKSKLAYPIRDGIPCMIVEEARPLTDQEIKSFSPSSSL